MGDGMDPREEQAVLAIARKVGVDIEGVNAARSEAREMIESSKDFGEASVDAIRYLLEGVGPEGELIAVAAARLTLPPVQRRDALTAINVGGAVTLGHKHTLDRRGREAVLGVAWAAAVRQNPSFTRRADLAAKHSRIAADLGDETDGPAIRGALDRHFEIELGAALEAAAVAA
jgi:hypothetical protein